MEEARPAELPEVEYQDDVEYTPHEKLDGELVVEGISLKPQFVGALTNWNWRDFERQLISTFGDFGFSHFPL